MAVFIDRAIRRGLIAACIAVAGYAAPAFALEFGALDVHSHLDQPLDATVVLKDLDASERASLDVGIAPPAMFQRFGIHRSSAVDRIHIDTTMTDGGRRAVVHIATHRPVREPFVDFLLQVESGNGSALREYTALLNPASEATNPSAAPTQTSAMGTHHTTQTSSRRAPSTGSTHRVQPGETLWSIAAANTPPNATVPQTMLAIYRANPSAFNGSMSALSGNARLTIPPATRIAAVDRAKAEQRLEGSHQAAADASAKSTEAGSAGGAGKLAASGEAPPARLKQSEASSPPSQAKTRSSDRTTGNADTAHPAPPASAGAFGTLSLPSDTPWPAAQTPAHGSQPAATGKPTPAAAPAPSKAESSNDKAASGTPRDHPEAAPKPAPKSTPKSVPHDTPPPNDVAEADGGTWFSPRNLLLLIVLLVLLAFMLRRLRERGYKRVELERGPPPASAAEAADTPPSSAASSPDTAPARYGAAAAMDTPTPREAEPTPVPAADTRSAVGPRPALTDRPVQEESPAEPVVSSPAVEPSAPTPSPTSASAAPVTEPEATAPQSKEPRPAATEPSTAPAEGAPMRFEHVESPVAGPRRDTHRRAATNEEIQALAFETQLLPETAERQHDRGGDDDSTMAFIETEQPAAPTSGAGDETPADEVRRPDPYGLEMIDPGEFDLYDPPSDTAGPTDDDPNHSVEIRLDLARMYIEMDDDQAARELLADVRERGDGPQRDEAARLLERLDA